MAEERTVSIKRKVIGYLIYFALLFVILMVFLAQVGVFDSNTSENSELYNAPEQTQTVENMLDKEEIKDASTVNKADENRKLDEPAVEKLKQGQISNSQNVSNIKNNTNDKTIISNNAFLPSAEPTHFPNKRIN